MYTREEELELVARIAITKEAFDLLRKEKKKQGISLAKITSNLIIEKYGNIKNKEDQVK